MKCKRKADGRSLDDAGKEAIRMRAVKMVMSAGESPEKVAQLLDINRRTIDTWLERFQSAGFDALRRKVPRCQPKTERRADELFGMIALRDPRQHGLPFALWTRTLVRELILREFKITLSEVSVGRTRFVGQAKTQMAAFISGAAYNLLRIAKLSDSGAVA